MALLDAPSHGAAAGFGTRNRPDSNTQPAAAQLVLSPQLRQGPLALCVARENLMSFAQCTQSVGFWLAFCRSIPGSCCR